MAIRPNNPFAQINRRLMQCGVIGIWLTLASVAVGATPQESHAANRARSLIEQRCQRCHGPTGISSSGSFPKLAGQNPEYLVRQMFNFLAGIRTSLVMKEQIDGLTGPDIEALAMYFSRQHINPDPVDDKAAVARGMVTYHGGARQGSSACVSCHGPYARGGQMLPRLAGQHATYLEQQMHAFIARARPSGPPGMHATVLQLNLSQIRDVAQYLSSLE